MTTITTTTPATTEGVLLGDEQTASVEGGGVLEHSGSLGEVIATEQLASIVISTPVTMTLARPPITQASIKGMSEPLSVAEVPSSLARYVRNNGDSSKQENDCLFMFSRVHSPQETSSCSNTATVTSPSFCSVSVAYSTEASIIMKTRHIDRYLLLLLCKVTLL